MNLFEYSFDNPLRYIDSNGCQPTSLTPNQQRFRDIFTQNQGNAARTLIQAFTDNGFAERRSWGASGASTRLETILDLTQTHRPDSFWNTLIPNLLHFGPAITGTGDVGFRPELRDSHLHPGSSNQIGHFLTGVDAGLHIFQMQFSLAPTSSGSALISRAIVGHELIPDTRHSIPRAVWAPSAGDVTNFLNDRLDLININPSQSGNSYQDLLLTRIGYGFAINMANGRFRTQPEAARWRD